jgi:hypothetical protein
VGKVSVPCQTFTCADKGEQIALNAPTSNSAQKKHFLIDLMFRLVAFGTALKRWICTVKSLSVTELDFFLLAYMIFIVHL